MSEFYITDCPEYSRFHDLLVRAESRNIDNGDMVFCFPITGKFETIYGMIPFHRSELKKVIPLNRV